MMTNWSKLLRGSCAFVTSGALILSNLAVMAQDQPPPGMPMPPSAAGEQPPPPAAQQLGQGELEKLLAPIALYPDDLVAQILTASTYPIEVVEAERWVGAHPNVNGDALSNEMQQQPWDPSVKGLTAVPQVLAMMNDKLDWTQQLGEAFLAQPNDVSNAIQQLRARAQANGNLKSSKEIKVSTELAPPPEPLAAPPPGVDPAMLPPPPPTDYISIEPVDPGVYYVPIYDPMVVYGPWGWPAYSPFYWYPPGYVVGAAVIGFGVGFFVGSALWAHYNWHGGGVSINVVNYNRFNHTNIVAGRGGMANWQFNAAHRGPVGFQNAALRQQFGRSAPGGPGGVSGSLQGNRSFAPNGSANFKGNGNTNQNNFNRNANLNQNKGANFNQNNGSQNGGNRNGNQIGNTNRTANFNRSNAGQNFNRGGNGNRGGGNPGRTAGGPPAGGNNKQQHHH
jgi:hypothetical protein